jgi:ATP-dependent DNA ligase
VDGEHNRSREGNGYDLPHINEAIKAINLPEGTILDGEVYLHNTEFNQLLSMIRNSDTRLQYWVYDIIMPGTYKERYSWLNAHLPKLGGAIRITPTLFVRTQKELDEAHAHNLKYGYEGSMIRNTKGIYEASYNSSDLIKLKDFEDAEFTIVEGNPGSGKLKNSCIFTCLAPNGGTFTCTAPGTIEYKEQCLRDIELLKGKPLTIRFQGYSEFGIPRIPIAIAIRDYE